MATTPGGWTGRVLRIDLTAGRVTVDPLNLDWARELIGGRGLATRYLYEELDGACDPLGPNNKLILVTGPLTGTYAPTGGRYMVVTKSPLTGAVACSNSGGYWGPELKFAGYDMVILEGKSPKPVYVWVYNDTVEIRDAAHVWGLTTSEAEKALRAETHQNARFCGIGPGGEKLALMACVINDETRAAGRSGVGAVMGSKNVKCVMVRGTKAITVADPQRFSEAVFDTLESVKATPGTSEELPQYGTAAAVTPFNEIAILPTRNFQSGQFEGVAQITGERQAEVFLRRNKGCFSCPIGCARVTEVKAPHRYAHRGEGAEYETIYGFGSDCGVDSLEAILFANRICNEYGLDTISAGATVATAMELYEKGFIDIEDIGFALQFGDADAMVKATEMMAKREGFGDKLAQGSYRLAEMYGHPELFMGVKKQEFAAYDPRAAVGMGLGYATSSRGACHTRAWTVGDEWGWTEGMPKNPYGTEGKAAIVMTTQHKVAVKDSGGICDFVSGAMSLDQYRAMLNYATGMNLSDQDLLIEGERIYNIERLFNTKAGFTRADDNLPDRLTKEGAPSGPGVGVTVNLEPMLDDYYALRGWDNNGIPKRETLERLKLPVLA